MWVSWPFESYCLFKHKKAARWHDNLPRNKWNLLLSVTGTSRVCRTFFLALLNTGRIKISCASFPLMWCRTFSQSRTGSPCFHRKKNWPWAGKLVPAQHHRNAGLRICNPNVSKSKQQDRINLLTHTDSGVFTTLWKQQLIKIYYLKQTKTNLKNGIHMNLYFTLTSACVTFLFHSFLKPVKTQADSQKALSEPNTNTNTNTVLVKTRHYTSQQSFHLMEDQQGAAFLFRFTINSAHWNYFYEEFDFSPFFT